jgi:hypothetical protein
MGRRHANVDQGEVRFVLANEREQLLRVAGLADDHELRAFEKTRKSLAQQDVVVREDNPRPADAIIRLTSGRESRHP